MQKFGIFLSLSPIEVPFSQNGIKEDNRGMINAKKNFDESY